jgi:hypothetical protein
MNPIYRSQHIANKYGEVFRNPIDEVDGAARYQRSALHAPSPLTTQHRVVVPSHTEF